jgi:hypothetical protein
MANKPKVNHTANIKWLESHGDSYAGKWVALLDGVLIASDDTLTALIAWLKQAGISDNRILYTVVFTSSENLSTEPAIKSMGGTREWATNVSLSWADMELARRNGHLSYTV